MDNEKNIGSVIAAAKNRKCEVLENEPLKKYTTFKIGGAASAIITVESTDVLAELYALCSKTEVPCMVIGNGSNLLFSDEGYNGVVFRLDGEFRSMSMLDEHAAHLTDDRPSPDGDDETENQRGDSSVKNQTAVRRIKCGAGVTLAKLCKFALDHELSGLEFAWGIPGSTGGAAFMNAGAYGGEMKDVIESVSYVSPDGTCGTLTAAQLDLSYRHSVFADKPGIITSVTVRLRHDDKKLIHERMDDFMERRRTKQPLEYPSAGSVFKRPEGYFAGALIQECGLKGKQIGGAQVSEKHSGFIINKGNATCNDVCELIEFIQETVYKEKGVRLECEVRKV